MTLRLSYWLVISLIVCGSPLRTTAQSEVPASAECNVPGYLYISGPTHGLKAILQKKDRVTILALGSSRTWAGGNSAATAFSAQLESVLKGVLPHLEIHIEHRSIFGELAEEAFERVKATVAEVEPDLVIWQVGTNAILARLDPELFQRGLADTLEWFTSHGLDVVLVDPIYNARLAADDDYKRIVAAIAEAAAEKHVPLVLRSEATRYLAEQKRNSKLNQFALRELSYGCLAEHLGRGIALWLSKNDAAAPLPGEKP